MRYEDKKVWPGKRFENQEIGDVENGRSVWFALYKENNDEDIIFGGSIIWEPDRSAPFEAIAEIE